MHNILIKTLKYGQFSLLLCLNILLGTIMVWFCCRGRLKNDCCPVPDEPDG